MRLEFDSLNYRSYTNNMRLASILKLDQHVCIN